MIKAKYSTYFLFNGHSFPLFSALMYSAVQSNAILCSAVRTSEDQCSAVQCSAVQYWKDGARAGSVQEVSHPITDYAGITALHCTEHYCTALYS